MDVLGAIFVGQIAKIVGGLVKDRKVKKLGWGWDGVRFNPNSIPHEKL